MCFLYSFCNPEEMIMDIDADTLVMCEACSWLPGHCWSAGFNKDSMPVKNSLPLLVKLYASKDCCMVLDTG